MPAKQMEIEVNLSVKNIIEIKARVIEVMDENDRLRATIVRLERQIAAGEQKDDEYAALVEQHVRNDILCENITEAVEDAEPDRQTPGELEWHTSFGGLYNEQPY